MRTIVRLGGDAGRVAWNAEVADLVALHQPFAPTLSGIIADAVYEWSSHRAMWGGDYCHGLLDGENLQIWPTEMGRHPIDGMPLEYDGEGYSELNIPAPIISGPHDVPSGPRLVDGDVPVPEPMRAALLLEDTRTAWIRDVDFCKGGGR
jgi:hypothetical protein